MSDTSLVRPVDSPTRSIAPLSWRLLLALALLSAMAPLATDLYLPALPEMAVDLSTSAAAVQLTLTALLLGVAVGQLVFGPASDRWGRFVPLMLGCTVCVIAGGAAALAPTVSWLVVARGVQGFGAAAGMVIGRAIVSDVTTGRQAARAFSLMMVVVAVAPVVAPLLGSLLVDSLGWRGLLWVIVAYALMLLVVVLAVVPRRGARPQPASDQPPRLERRLSGLSRGYWSYLVVGCAGFGALMAYISASPFFYQQVMGLDARQYGLMFAANAAALVAASVTSAQLLKRHTARVVLRAGLWGLTAAAGAGLVLSALPGGVHWVWIPLMAAVASLGLILGTAAALALAGVTRAGLGSALLGASQFAAGAVVSPLVSLGETRGSTAMCVVMASCALVALMAYRASRRAVQSV